MRGSIVVVSHPWNSVDDFYTHVFHFPSYDAAQTWVRLHREMLEDKGYGINVLYSFDDPDDFLVDYGIVWDDDEEEEEELS